MPCNASPPKRPLSAFSVHSRRFPPTLAVSLSHWSSPISQPPALSLDPFAPPHSNTHERIHPLTTSLAHRLLSSPPLPPLVNNKKMTAAQEVEYTRTTMPAKLRDYQQFGRPVLVGEFSNAMAHPDDSYQAAFGKVQLQAFATAQAGWFFWSLKHNISLGTIWGRQGLRGR
ncbi:unnamed protein product [Closterium sp. Naga37s-1]|nr:unnamed protein product [Closterium sp. Naga37s-1]